MVDRTILQYRFVEKLGAGGMGEIYKAQDTRLNRFVAMKVLPAGMSADPDSRRRFVQEAQAASALNHPNIITIYDIVSDGEIQYMVMEYVAGKTLLELIPKDGLRVPQAIPYAAQMAEALAAAHAAGIVHRDLKPANVMVTAGGLVKLLDFGLAKLIGPGDVDDNAKTVTRLQAPPLTIEGTMMGTVNYMSPEQAEGRRLDARSDIFSFGAVLYEMLTGRRAFRGDSTISILSAVLRDDIQPIPELTPDVPLELEQVVVGCLKKDPDQRFQSMEGVRAVLTALKRQLDSGSLYNRPAASMSTPAPSARRADLKPAGSKALGFAAACVLAVAAAGCVGYWWMTRRPPVAPAPVSAPAVSAPAEPRPSAFADSRKPDGASNAPLNNDSILQMVEAGVAPSVIVSQIQASKTDFNLSAAEVIRLSKAGAPPAVIEAMRNPRAEVVRKPANTAAVISAPAVLGDGLPIRLILAEDVPSDAGEGDAVRFKVADDVRVNFTVVIPQGASAAGAIVDGAKKKILGLGGKTSFRLESANAAGGQKVTIRATPVRHGDGPSKRPFKQLSAGARYEGYIDGAQTILVVSNLAR